MQFVRSHVAKAKNIKKPYKQSQVHFALHKHVQRSSVKYGGKSLLISFTMYSVTLIYPMYHFELIYLDLNFRKL